MIKDVIDKYLENGYDEFTSLCSLYNHYGSDKANWHNYAALYDKLFRRFAEKEFVSEEKINFFEVGLGTNNVDVPSNMGSNGKPGASLYAISHRHPLWNVYGADVDKRILFNVDKIKTYYVDQTNISTINDLWNNDDLIDIEFDVILDDGLHKFEANILFYENSIHKLKRGGLYIIEDIYEFELFDEYRKSIEYPNYLFRIPNSVNNYDNTLLIVEKV